MITALPVTDRRLTDLYINLPVRLYRHDHSVGAAVARRHVDTGIA
jgi:hypothetical protein